MFVMCLNMGCTKTGVGGVVYFPPEAVADSAKYRLVLDIEGAYRKAYTARTNKFIRIVIWNGEKSYYIGSIQLQLLTSNWDVLWDKEDDLQITFFDFPEGESGYGGFAFKRPSKEIISVSYTYDATSGTFTEKPLRKEILNHARRWLKSEK